jgi:hypothetical protein
MTKEELREVMEEVLNHRRTIDDDRHDAHHRFIESELLRRERREAAWEKFRMSFIGGMALLLIGALTWVGQLVIDALKRGSHP